MDQDIKQEFEKLYEFLRANMVTKQEFNEVKAEFHRRFDVIEQSLNTLTEAVERLAKLVKDIADEHQAMKHQVMAMQDWIRKVAEKIGVEFKI